MKCCCCLSVTVGATILGALGLTMSILELIAILPFLFSWDLFNPIDDNLKHVTYIMEKIFEEYGSSHGYNKEDFEEIKEDLTQLLWPVLLAEAVCTGVYVLFCVLLIVGVETRRRALMLPYMIVQMCVIVVVILFGLLATTGLFFLNVIMGVIFGVVLLVVSFLIVYFWVVVQRAYTELGMYINYSPAPIVKPMYAIPYPTAPQHFSMDDSKQC